MAEEKYFENRIKNYLEEQGCYYFKYFANRMTRVGIPDIIACVNGSYLGVEVKSSTGKPSELQIYNINKINNAGGFAVVVAPESFKELKELIQDLKQRERYEARKKVNKLNDKYAKFF